MKVLITGSDGYIGGNLTSYLKSKDIETEGIDSANGKNILNYNDYNGLDAIVHLAGVSGITQCNDNLESATTNNVVSSIMIFNAARKYEIPLIFTSSQAAKNPHSNIYALTKKMCEIEADRVNRCYGNIKMFRLTNVYGGIGYLEKKDTVISRFIKAVKKNEDIIINGTGSQIRDFIHMNDVCEAIFKGLLYTHNINYPIDIGTGRPLSILDIAEMFNHRFTFDKKSDKIGIGVNVADIYPAYKELGFLANEVIEDYIERMK